MSGEEGKVAAIPSSPKILISLPRQMCKDDSWGQLVLIMFSLCHGLVSPVVGE